MKTIIMMLMGVGVALNSAIATPAVSDISVRQRYPWNGLVDLKFTVTGTSGTRYDTFFTAKDMVGGTNVVMKTIRKSDGTIAAAKEQLLPGTYNWVWDAPADLPDGFESGRMIVTGMAEEVDMHDKVQLWEGGPYWATTNIGAEKPEDYGYYFWWGDTIGYKWENDKWVASDGSNFDFSFKISNTPTCNKYISELQREGWITTDGVLASDYDAATIHWGNGWRMPTRDDLDALNSNCDWTWTTMNGVYGFIVRGKGAYALNSIFIPAAGRGYWASLDYAGEYGFYWLSELPTGTNASSAWQLLFFQSSRHSASPDAQRCYGQTVRPLKEFTK